MQPIMTKKRTKTGFKAIIDSYGGPNNQKDKEIDVVVKQSKVGGARSKANSKPKRPKSASPTAEELFAAMASPSSEEEDKRQELEQPQPEVESEQEQEPEPEPKPEPMPKPEQEPKSNASSRESSLNPSDNKAKRTQQVNENSDRPTRLMHLESPVMDGSGKSSTATAAGDQGRKRNVSSPRAAVESSNEEIGAQNRHVYKTVTIIDNRDGKRAHTSTAFGTSNKAAEDVTPRCALSTFLSHFLVAAAAYYIIVAASSNKTQSRLKAV